LIIYLEYVMQKVFVPVTPDILLPVAYTAIFAATSVTPKRATFV